jgi:hypothetical protein
MMTQSLPAELEVIENLHDVSSGAVIFGSNGVQLSLATRDAARRRLDVLLWVYPV